MRKKVGFTLIELLAVMIILGIIFLIAYPVVLNLIKEARIKSAIQSAYGYIEAVNIEVSVRKLETNKILDNTYNILETDLNVKHKGTTPSHGLLTILNGRVNNADLCINSYPIEYRNGVAVYNKENAICPVEYKFIEPEGTIIADLCNGGEYSSDVDYKIKTVEDLVCLEKIVNDDDNNITFENNTIMLLSDLDIEDKKTYKAANALASYDINENGTIESIYTELTTDKGFNPIGSSSTPFKGTFEGYGFTISNLYINRTTNNTGLIGYMSAGSVTGLNLENVNVTGAQYTGGVVGYSTAGTTINEISISGNITGTSNVGGIAGYFYESSNTLKSVIVNANVTGTNEVGGIVGKAYATTIVKGVVESGTITATSGVLVGNVSGYRGTVTAYVSDAVEVTASSNSEKRNGTSYSSSYTNNKHSIGMYDNALDTWIGGDNDSSGYYIDYDSNGKLTIYSTERNPMTFDLEGEGTSESPYIINSVSDWKQAVLKNKSGYYFKLNTDLNFENQEFYPMGTTGNYFVGNIYGNAYTISNLDIKGLNNTGLIGYMSAGSVTGLNLENINVTGAQYTGGVVGYSAAGTTINEISISGNITGTSNVGGIAGYFYETSNTLKSVIVNANVTGTNEVGGIVGKAYATTIVKGVVESGTITATSGVLVGNVSGYRGTVTAYVSDAVEVTASSNSEKRNGTSYPSSYANSKHSIGMYDDALDTWIGGDNDSSGYYIDYDSNGKLTIYSIERNPMTFDLEGEGTSESPYIINSVSDWKQAVLKNKSGYYFKLNTDLNFENQEFYPMGTTGNYFVGNIYGNAYTISNLDIKGLNNTGLIGYMSAGSVTGLNIENINVTGARNTGGVVGYSTAGTTINEISISGNITGTSNVGGIAGYFYETSNTIKSVIVNADVTGTTSYVGGIVGESYYSTILGVIESGSVTTSTGYGGKISGRQYSSTSVGYSSDSVILTKTTSGKDGTSYPSSYANSKHSIGMYDDALDTWIGGDNDSSGYYIDYDSNGKLKVYSIERNPMTFDLKGEGTSESPYIINSVSDWKQAVLKNKSGYYFKLNADLDFNNKEFYPMGTNGNYFNGYLYGNAYTISNLDIKGLNNTGLIGYMSLGEVAGLNLENINVTGARNTGGVVGYSTAGTTINEISISGNITGTSNVGGIAGYFYETSNTIKSVIVNADVTGTTSYVGGIVGESYYSTILGVIESGSVTTSTGYGGKISGRRYSSTSVGYSSDSVILTKTTSGEDGTSYPSSYTNDKHSIGMYDEVLDTWIGGDNDSSGYYIDYNSSGKLTIYSTERNPMTFDLEGEGTSESPYIINSVSDWKQAALKNNLGYYFKLNADLNFENQEFYPLGTTVNYFNGYLYGNAYIISNLDIKGINNVGLIGYMSAGEVVGLNVENINITGTSYMGGVVGYLNDGTIKEVSLSGNIIGRSYLGGVAGYSKTSTAKIESVILNSIVIGGDTGAIGGVLGTRASTIPVTAVVDDGSLSTNTGVLGKIVGGSSNTFTGTSYASDSITVTRNNTGGDGTLYPSNHTNNKHSIGMYDEVLDTWIGGDNDSSGYYIDYDSNRKFIIYSTERNPMTFNLNGEGTSESPYIINSVSDWKQAALKNNLGYYFKLNADLNFENQEFYPLGTTVNYFNGYLYGNAYTISNLDIKGVNNVGLIGYMSAGEVAGLNVENINITGTSYMGGVVGYLNDGTIKEVSLSGNIIGRSYLGGVAGYSKTSTAKIESVLLSSIIIEGETGAIGGVLGNRASTIPVTAVVESGTLSTNTGYLGKIVGGASNTFTGTSYASDSITVTRNYKAGDGTSFSSEYVNNLDYYTTNFSTVIDLTDSDSNGILFGYKSINGVNQIRVIKAS